MKKKIHELIKLISKGVSISKACRIMKINRYKLYYRSPKLQLYLLSLSVVSKKHNYNTMEMQKYKYKINEKMAITKDNEYWENYFKEYNKNEKYSYRFNKTVISVCDNGTYLNQFDKNDCLFIHKKISGKKLTEKQIEKFKNNLLKEIN